MAAWSDFESLAEVFDGKSLGDDVLLLEFDVERGAARPQQVYLTRESIGPGFDVVKASSVIASAEVVDMAAVFREYGDLNIGSLQYVPSAPPLIALGIVFALPVVDFSDPGAMMAVLHSLAETARAVARRIGGII